jgi:CRISPR-associated endonuclease/helicase Cas3
LHKGESTTRELLSLPDFDLQTPESYRSYFSCFYAKVNDTGTRFREWLTPDDSSTLAVHFRTAAQNFRFIDDQEQQPVIVRYGRSEMLIGTLQRIGPNRILMRQLQRYIVNLPARMANLMLEDGRLEEIGPGILVQSNLSIYDSLVGLDIYKESLPVEDLVN